MMNLTPTELDRLTLFTAAELARRYRSQGIRLSHPEAVALIADEVITAARRGLSHPELVAHGKSLLTTDDVEPGVDTMIPVISVEVSMAEGTKLVALFSPIGPGREPVDRGLTPGEIIPGEGEIEVNAGRDRIEIDVINTGDRTIQVRSHTHFFEVNRALAFDREAAFGRRLDAPSGTGARFDPGVAKRVALVPYGGAREVHGARGLTDGPADDPAVRAAALRRMAEGA